MSFPTRLLGFTAAAFVLVSSAPASDGPAFHPAAGSDLTKTFVYGVDFSLDEFSAIVSGQDIGQMLGSLEATLEVQNTIAVTDSYVSSEDGHPTKLVRSFGSLEGVTSVGLTMDFGSEDQDVTSSSELEGSTVVFDWNEDEGAFDVSFEEGEGDADLLDGLAEDMDLRALLPPGEVSADDTWDVDLKLLEGIAFPGGDLKLLPEEVGDEPFEEGDVVEGILDGDYGEQLADLLEGSCICTYEGVTEAGLGEIHVAIEISSAVDLTDMLADIAEAIGESVGEAPPITIELADLNLDFEGEGVLLWNLEQGRVDSFELDADAIVAIDLGISVEADGESQSAELSAEMSGSYSYQVETEE